METKYWDVQFRDSTSELLEITVEAETKQEAEASIPAGYTAVAVIPMQCRHCNGSGTDSMLPDDALCEHCNGSGENQEPIWN